MRKLFLFIPAILFCFKSFSQQLKVSVFKSGTEGHKSYRIPAIISLPNGCLLAFCEGRVNGSVDFGDVNIVMKRSADGGKKWGSLQTIVDYSNLQAGNPAPVVDISDTNFPQGRIFLFYNTGNNTENEVRKSNGLREVWYKTSVDNGLTWSEAVNITLQVHRPKQPQLNKAYNFTEDWRAYANTPGHAIQFSTGNYKGRIYVPANHTAGNPLPYYIDGKTFGYYSDDHGKTFHISSDINIPGSNEASVAELANGKLIINARNQQGNVKARIVGISSNGGQTWDTAYYDKNLPDPVCEGSLLTVKLGAKKRIIAFCNAADTALRNNLTLRISYDEGKSWKKNIVVDKSPISNNKSDFTAYSDILTLPKKRIGVLYERDNYKEIAFTTIKW